MIARWVEAPVDSDIGTPVVGTDEASFSVVRDDSRARSHLRPSGFDEMNRTGDVLRPGPIDTRRVESVPILRGQGSRLWDGLEVSRSTTTRMRRRPRAASPT